jgi:hypothetical protein
MVEWRRRTRRETTLRVFCEEDTLPLGSTNKQDTAVKGGGTE